MWFSYTCNMSNVEVFQSLTLIVEREIKMKSINWQEFSTKLDNFVYKIQTYNWVMIKRQQKARIQHYLFMNKIPILHK